MTPRDPMQFVGSRPWGAIVNSHSVSADVDQHISNQFVGPVETDIRIGFKK